MVDKKQTNLNDILVTGTKKIIPVTLKNMNDQDIKKEKNMGGRTPKNEKYAKDRKIILDKTLQILNITKENNIFYVCDLENNNDKIKQLNDLVADIKTYFSYGTWTFFAKTGIPFPYTTLVRAIFRDMNVKFDSVSIRNNKTNKILKQGYIIYL